MKLRLGVSACLLGERVRWNGGHEEEPFLTQTLAPFVEWVPVCPEVEVGLGVPRPTLRLERAGDGDDRLVESGTGRDHAPAMRAWSDAYSQALGDLDGFVLKRLSPSCGPDRLRVYAPSPPQGGPRARGAANVVATDGAGLFAAALAERKPMLPRIDDGRLQDPGLREAFLDRVFAHARWRGLGPRPRPAALNAFHARHKYTLLAHDPAGAQRLGQMLARKAGPAEYGPAFMQVLARPATRAKHANVLAHVRGFVKGRLGEGTQRELDGLLSAYRAGLVPLIVPVTLLQHLLRVHDAPAWIREQTYLDPYPMELMLRNHA